MITRSTPKCKHFSRFSLHYIYEETLSKARPVANPNSMGREIDPTSLDKMRYKVAFLKGIQTGMRRIRGPFMIYYRYYRRRIAWETNLALGTLQKAHV